MKHLPYKWKALLTVAFGTMLSTLDASIITIAFPELARVFHADLTAVMWVSVAFILVISGTMLAFGKLSDFIGRKRVYTAGLGIVTIGMAACSLAQNVEQIIIFRIVQALGAAMSIGCGTAIVTEAFPPEDLGKGLGNLGVAVSVGFVIGPVTGGVLLGWFDWRAIFYMRIPLGVLAFTLALLLLRKDSGRREKISFDIMGAVTSFAGLFCLIFGMGQVKAHGLTSLVVVVFVSAGLAILCLFLFIESRARDPIVGLSLFRNHTFACAMAGLFLFFLIPPLYIIIMPFYLMDAIELPPAKAGLLLSVIPVATMIASPISGFLSDRFGPRWPSTLGASAVAAAFFCMFWFDLQTEIWAIISVFALLGLGIGVFQPPNNSTVMRTVEKERLGSVSALMGTVRQVAISIGMALTGAVFAIRQSAYHDVLQLKGLEASQLLRHSIAPAIRDVILIIFLPTLAVLALSSMSPTKTITEPSLQKEDSFR